MDRVSKHFRRSEFRCKCGKCGFAAVDVELLTRLEEMRSFFCQQDDRELILVVHSGCRCEAYNKKVGGAVHSKHKLAIAADTSFRYKDKPDIIAVPPSEVFQYLDNRFPNTYGIGLYNTFVHFDVRRTKARWKSY